MADTRIWAHRGASGYAPENTLEAFQKAVDMQADGVELDVQMTREGQLVVIHDEAIDRVSDGSGYVKDFTLRELRRFNYNRTHPEYEYVEIPTLEEVFTLLAGTALQINIELKTGIFFYDGIEERVLGLVKKYGLEERIWYSSFNHYSMIKIKEMNKNARTGLLYSHQLVGAPDYAKRLGTCALHPGMNVMKYEGGGIADECRRHDIRLHVWSVDSEEDMRLCFENGVDAIITNYPDRAVMNLKSMKRESSVGKSM